MRASLSHDEKLTLLGAVIGCQEPAPGAVEALLRSDRSPGHLIPGSPDLVLPGLLEFAGARCEVPQTPAAGNGAHSLEASCPSSTTGECAPAFTGSTLVDLEQMVNRSLAANRVIERIAEPCPQGQDCAGDGRHDRIFDCEQGCGFRGCVMCLAEHEAEPHWSDADTARARAASY